MIVQCKYLKKSSHFWTCSVQFSVTASCQCLNEFCQLSGVLSFSQGIRSRSLTLLCFWVSGAYSWWRKTFKTRAWNTQKPLCETGDKYKYKHSNALIFNSLIWDHSQKGWEKVEGSWGEPSQEGSCGWVSELPACELTGSLARRVGSWAGLWAGKETSQGPGFFGNWWVLPGVTRNLSGWGNGAEDVCV